MLAEQLDVGTWLRMLARGASVGNLRRGASKTSESGPHVAVRKTTILDALGQSRKSKRAMDANAAVLR